jgi:hypothetical protein
MQRDTVLRWIDQIGPLIARLLRRDTTISVQLVREQLADARAMLLGPIEPLAAHLDPPQAAALLIDPFRIHGYSQLLALESAVERLDGRDDNAARLTARAIALAKEAIERDDPAPREWTEWVAAAERELPASPK